MNVSFNNKTYELKYSFRALMIYENITGTSFEVNKMSDIICFFYSVLVSSARPDIIDFDKFVDYLDENPQLITEFYDWLIKTAEQQNKLLPDTNEDVKDSDKGDPEKNY